MTRTATATTAAPKPEYKAMSLAFSMPERHKKSPKWLTLVQAIEPPQDRTWYALGVWSLLLRSHRKLVSS